MSVCLSVCLPHSFINTHVCSLSLSKKAPFVISLKGRSWSHFSCSFLNVSSFAIIISLSSPFVKALLIMSQESYINLSLFLHNLRIAWKIQKYHIANRYKASQICYNYLYKHKSVCHIAYLSNKIAINKSTFWSYIQSIFTV